MAHLRILAQVVVLIVILTGTGWCQNSLIELSATEREQRENFSELWSRESEEVKASYYGYLGGDRIHIGRLPD